MKKNAIILLAFTMISMLGFAQKNKGAAEKPWEEASSPKATAYEQGKSGTVILKVGPIDGKDANIMKKKAGAVALHDLMVRGYSAKGNIPPQPKFLPGGASDWDKDVEFFTKYCMPGGNGHNYINETKPLGELSKMKKLLTGDMLVEINIMELRKDLEASGKIKGMADFLFKPSVLIVPSKQWMKDNGFHQMVDLNGQQVDQFDYQGATMSNKHDMDKAVKQISANYGDAFDVKDMMEMLGKIREEESNPVTGGTEVQESKADIYARVIAADLWLELDLSVNVLGGGKKQLIFSMSAIDPSTSSKVINGDLVDKSSVGNDFFNLMKASLDGASANFQPKLYEYFMKREKDGYGGNVIVMLSDDIDGDFNTRMDVEGQKMALREIVEFLLMSNSNEKAFKPIDVSSPTRAEYSIKIPAMTTVSMMGKTREVQNSIDKFANKMATELETYTEWSCKAYSKGLGKSYITVLPKED